MCVYAIGNLLSLFYRYFGQGYYLIRIDKRIILGNTFNLNCNHKNLV